MVRASPELKKTNMQWKYNFYSENEFMKHTHTHIVRYVCIMIWTNNVQIMNSCHMHSRCPWITSCKICKTLEFGHVIMHRFISWLQPTISPIIEMYRGVSPQRLIDLTCKESATMIMRRLRTFIFEICNGIFQYMKMQIVRCWENDSAPPYSGEQSVTIAQTEKLCTKVKYKVECRER